MPRMLCHIAPHSSVAPREAARRFIDSLKSATGFLVAVSGGSDSTGLLVALNEALPASGRTDLRFHAATIDHALRPDSAEEARNVAALCETLGIPHYIRRWNAAKPSTGLSAAAREARYHLLSEIATEAGASAIVTAHTAGDQMETAAMRAQRSARDDNSGLAGMANAVLYRRQHWILRPFLNCTRQDIRDFLHSRNLGWVDDPGNSNLASERIRIRTRFAEEGQGNTADLDEAADRRQALSHLSAKLLQEHGRIYHGVLGRIARGAYGSDRTVFRHTLGVLAAVFGGRNHLPASDTMDRVMDFMEAGQPGRLSAGRAIFDLRRDAVYIYRENRGIAPQRLEAGQSILWDNRFRVANHGSAAVTIGHGSWGINTAYEDVPTGVVSRMESAAFPLVSGHSQDISIERVLALFDVFLPAFDLELAEEIARMVGRESFGQPPFANLTATY